RRRRPRRRTPQGRRHRRPQARPLQPQQEEEDMTRRHATALALALTLTLAACAPATRTTQVRAPALPPLTPAEHYHPNEPGTTLTYLDAEGNQYRLETLAPRLLSGTATQHQRYEGPGVNRSAYRRDTPQGLLLLRVDDATSVTT